VQIGILGSGLMGGKLGTIFARAGHEVVFSYARSERKLKRLARDAQGKARAGTPADAARDADALLLAVHWLRVDDVLQQAGDVSGKVIVSWSLPTNANSTGLVLGHTSSGAEELAKKIRRAKVVSAFGTVPSEVFFGVFDARRKANRPSMVYLRGRRRGEGRRGRADPRRRFRASRRRPSANRPLPGAVRAPHGTTRVRGRLRIRGRVPFRAIRTAGIPRLSKERTA
jgi:8-hydroxy-5-deazaflavin:NADPH oxidoreductase